MNYWHIQMALPQGRGEIRIDSSLLLKEDAPVISTGEWDNFQCRDFKNKIQIGDIVCVRDGKKPIALCKVIGDNFTDANLSSKYLNINFRLVEVLEFYTGEDSFPQAQGTLRRAIDKNTSTWQFINNWYKSTEIKK